MFIKPIEMGQGFGFGTEGISGAEGPGGAVPFKSMFQDAIQNVSDTEKQTALDTELLATGQIDDLHTLGIDSTKAYLSVRLLVEMRNRALDAYSEIMRVNL